nr:retrotransposon protein, putative, unclassified [Ipomoea batatas]
MVYALMSVTRRMMKRSWKTWKCLQREVRDALFSIAPYKAPGPDGFHAGFYKNAWGIVGKDITSTMSDFFNNAMMDEGWNDTLIALILKVKWPEKEVAERITVTAGVGEVEDLGRYLGIPSIHGCVTDEVMK